MRNLFSTPDTDVFSRGTNDNIELLKAWAGTGLAFAIVQTGPNNLLSSRFLTNLLISAIVCGLGFVLHELAHRVVARSYGAQAHFIANNGWLLMSIVLSFAGFFIAAPGAVWHRGMLNARQSGLIALAGPVTNLVLSILFLVLLLAVSVLQLPLAGWVITTCYIGFKFNAWLGLFNMIPAGPFDGAKVLNWDWRVFGVTVAFGIALTFLVNDQLLFNMIRMVRGL